MSQSIHCFLPERNVAIGRGGDANNKHLERVITVRREMIEKHSIVFKVNTFVCSLNWEEDMTSFIHEL